MPTAATDSETRASHDDHIALRAWLRLLTCSNLIEQDLRTRLRTRFESTLPRFDLLAQLERERDGLTMGELSKRLMVSGGNVTGLVTQLVNEGHVVREPHPQSRRTFVVTLTPRGRRSFSRMAREHETWVQDLFGDLSRRDVQALLTLLGKLKSSVRSHETE